MHAWRVVDILYSQVAPHIYCIFFPFSPQMKMLAIKHGMEKDTGQYSRGVMKAQSKQVVILYLIFILQTAILVFTFPV